MERMDPDKIKKIVTKYKNELSRQEIIAKEFTFGGCCPRPDNPKHTLEHVQWMLIEIEKFLNQARIEEARHWLRFVQGCLWSSTSFGLEEMKL